MKIHQSEIDAAHEALSYVGYNIADDEMERVLEAAYTVRKQRKEAKRKSGADKLLNAVRELKEAIELGGEGLIVHTPEDIAKRERQRKALVDNDEIGEFKPCVVQYEEARITEIVLEDCFTVWVPHEGLELGYNNEGNLIAVKVYGLVAQRKEKNKQVVESVKPADFNSPQLMSKWDTAKGEIVGSTAGGVYPSKAPEWDGTVSLGNYSNAAKWDGKFGLGTWEMRNGGKAVVDYIWNGRTAMRGKVGDVTITWQGNGTATNMEAFDLIRPWPKGEQ